jgi:integrase/recombinase XerC
MAKDLVLHEQSRWRNPSSRKLNAARAAQQRDEVSLGSLLEAYLKLKSRKRASISARTLLRYKHALKPLFDYLWQPEHTTNLLQVDAVVLEGFVTHLSQPQVQRERHKSGQRVYSRNSIDLIIIATRALFKALLWSGAMTRDPTDELRSPNLPRVERQPVLPPERLTEFRALPLNTDPVIAARDGAIFELGLSAMLRSDEIVGLNLEDFDASSGVLKVQGKGGKLRYVPLSKTPLEALRGWLEVRSKLQGSRDSNALFLSASRRNPGGRMSYHGVYGVIRGAFRQLEAQYAGLKLGGLHTLRRSGATRFHRKHKDLVMLADQLGHASLETTRRYVKLDLNERRRALEAVDEAD